MFPEGHEGTLVLIDHATLMPDVYVNSTANNMSALKAVGVLTGLLVSYRRLVETFAPEMDMTVEELKRLVEEETIKLFEEKITATIRTEEFKE